MGLRFSAVEIPTLKQIWGVGVDGGARKGKDRAFEFKTLWNRSFKLV